MTAWDLLLDHRKKAREKAGVSPALTRASTMFEALAKPTATNPQKATTATSVVADGWRGSRSFPRGPSSMCIKMRQDIVCTCVQPGALE
jgi:hypothetical protein